MHISSPHPSVRGFTLVELLVVIAVLAVVISLIVATVGATRRGSRELKCVVQIRECSTVLAQYAAEYKEFYPAWGARDLRQSFLESDDPPPTWWGWYFQAQRWPMVCRGYFGADGLTSIDVAVCPSNRPNNTQAVPTNFVFGSSYILSFGLYSTPQAWTGEMDAASVDAMKAVRISDVVWPAQKGAMVERFLYHSAQSSDAVSQIDKNPSQAARFPTAFVDGSAAAIWYADFARWQTTSWFIDDRTRYAGPVLTTKDGYRGVDRK